MGITQRDGDDKLAALFEVVDTDGAVMHFDERTCQVEADTRAGITVVCGRVGLIEALENLLEFILRNLLTIVADSDGGIAFVVGETDADLTARRCILKGVGKHVDNHLIEV